MPIPQIPDVLKNVIAHAGDIKPIPDNTASGSGDLSYAQGWPSLTALPLEAGGVAPEREFFNAIYNLMSQHLFFSQSGGVYPWREGLNYLAGNHIQSGGQEYVALLASGPDIPGVGIKTPGTEETAAYWKAVSFGDANGPSEILPKGDGEAALGTDNGYARGDHVHPRDTSFATALNQPGMVGYFAGPTAPTGWLKANGALLSRTTYAALFAAIGTTFGAGDGSTTFKLPDLRGEFLRGFDDGRSVDAGRAFGSAQGDAIRNVVGEFYGAAGTTYGFGAPVLSGAFGKGGAAAYFLGAAGSTTGASSAIKFDASLVVPTAAENRPRNVALLACIKY